MGVVLWGKSESMGSDNVVERWLSEINGTPLPEPKRSREEPVRCDFCGEVIEWPTTVTHYGVDTVLNEGASGSRSFGLLRVYCRDCDRREVVFPCEGFNEVVLESKITGEGLLDEFRILDVSSSSSGIAWDPDEVWELTHGERFTESIMSQMLTVGPEDVVDDLASDGIDIASVMNGEGDIVVDESDVERMRD